MSNNAEVGFYRQTLFIYTNKIMVHLVKKVVYLSVLNADRTFGRYQIFLKLNLSALINLKASKRKAFTKRYWLIPKLSDFTDSKSLLKQYDKFFGAWNLNLSIYRYYVHLFFLQNEHPELKHMAIHIKSLHSRQTDFQSFLKEIP